MFPQGDATRIRYTQDNPKRAGSAAHALYEKYKGATTVGEAKTKGARQVDFVYDLKREYLEVLPSVASEITGRKDKKAQVPERGTRRSSDAELGDAKSGKVEKPSVLIAGHDKEYEKDQKGFILRTKGGGKSKYQGVHFINDKWTPRVKLASGPTVTLGAFDTEEEAAQTYADVFFGRKPPFCPDEAADALLKAKIERKDEAVAAAAEAKAAGKPQESWKDLVRKQILELGRLEQDRITEFLTEDLGYEGARQPPDRLQFEKLGADRLKELIMFLGRLRREGPTASWTRCDAAMTARPTTTARASSANGGLREPAPAPSLEGEGKEQHPPVWKRPRTEQPQPLSDPGVAAALASWAGTAAQDPTMLAAYTDWLHQQWLQDQWQQQQQQQQQKQQQPQLQLQQPQSEHHQQLLHWLHMQHHQQQQQQQQQQQELQHHPQQQQQQQQSQPQHSQVHPRHSPEAAVPRIGFSAQGTMAAADAAAAAAAAEAAAVVAAAQRADQEQRDQEARKAGLPWAGFRDGGGWELGYEPFPGMQMPRIPTGETQPPGPCAEGCHCTQVASDITELEKPWLKDARRKQIALEAAWEFERCPGVFRRGKVSNMNRFEPAPAGAASIAAAAAARSNGAAAPSAGLPRPSAQVLRASNVGSSGGGG